MDCNTEHAQTGYKIVINRARFVVNVPQASVLIIRMVVCAGSLTITFDPTSGQRSYSNLENFHEVFWGTKLQGKG